jgi:membrane protease subunit HflC
MKKTVTTIVVGFIIFISLLIAGPLYVIEEGEQAVIVQMGRIVRVVTDAGLYFKAPFIDEVVRYPKRIMSWDGEQTSIPTREKQYIWVDVTARWRISDPKKFYESISSIDRAYSKLAEVIDSEVKTVTAENYFRETVRNSNIIMDRASSVDDLGIGDEIDPSIIQSSIRSDENFEPVEKGRRGIAEEILERSRRMVPEYGIELIDVVTRQIRYSEDLTQSVYARMIKERNQIAQAIRSEGEGRKAALLGRMTNEQMDIRSAAYNRAETIRGEADAEAARIYTNSYNRDAGTRSFYDFWRAIESYRQTMPQFDKTMTTDMEYFRYLYSPR